MFDARGAKLYYLVKGAEEPVVLIHGLYSSARIHWQLPGTIAALVTDYRVVVLNLPDLVARTGRLQQTRMVCNGSRILLCCSIS
jgi:pimeloyl-ACP methyl ester carboxylesterase